MRADIVGKPHRKENKMDTIRIRGAYRIEWWDDEREEIKVDFQAYTDIVSRALWQNVIDTAINVAIYHDIKYLHIPHENIISVKSLDVLFG